jgi:hypothetical protein
MDLSSLIDEMDDMGSFDQPKARRTGAVRPDEKGTAPKSAGAYGPTFASTLRQTDKVSKGAKKKKPSNDKIVANKHKTWGECPVDLMADFLAAVSAGELGKAMKMSDMILTHEPDNPLIKMYQGSLGELITAQKAEEKRDDSGEDDDEDTDNFITFNKIKGEQQSEDEASDDSGSEEENEGGVGVAEDKHDGLPYRAETKDSKGAK